MVDTHMNSKPPHLSRSQERFLQDVRTDLGREVAEQRFILTNSGNRKSLRWKDKQITCPLSDTELFDLHRLEYISVYPGPENSHSSIEFHASIWDYTAEETPQKPGHDTAREQRTNDTHRVLIIQVYSWLVASILAAFCFLGIFLFAALQALRGNIAVAVASAIMDVISALATSLFFQQWRHANEWLRSAGDGRSDDGNANNDDKHKH